jgi:hypothetical protein
VFITVNYNVWKSAIALYCLYLNVIKRECVTKVLINPSIRTRTRHFRRAYHPTRGNMITEIPNTYRMNQDGIDKVYGRSRPLPNFLLRIIMFTFISTFFVVETEALNGKMITNQP